MLSDMQHIHTNLWLCRLLSIAETIILMLLHSHRRWLTAVGNEKSLYYAQKLSKSKYYTEEYYNKHYEKDRNNDVKKYLNDFKEKDCEMISKLYHDVKNGSLKNCTKKEMYN